MGVAVFSFWHILEIFNYDILNLIPIMKKTNKENKYFTKYSKHSIAAWVIVI